MPHRKLNVVAFMTGVGTSRSIAPAERVRQRSVADAAEVAAVSRAQELAFPGLSHWQPDFKVEYRIAGWPRNSYHPAERWDDGGTRQAGGTGLFRWSEDPRRHINSGGDRNVWQRQGGETGARPCSSRTRNRRCCSKQRRTEHQAAHHERSS